MLPSGSGERAMGKNLSGLMPARVALTSADTRTFPLSFTFSMAPPRALMVTMLPSTFSIWPRMRVGGVCAKALAVNTSARPAPIKALCVIFMVSSPGVIAAHYSRAVSQLTPGRSHYSSLPEREKMSLFLEQISLDQGTQFRRHLGCHAEPAFEAPHRLMQQHAEPVGRAQAARAGALQQSGFQRRIDQVRHHQRGRKVRAEFQRRLPNHAQARAVDQKARLAQRPRDLIPTGDVHAR